jgi:hypothetical protein
VELNDSPLRLFASRSVSHCDILRATFAVGESWALCVLALCIVCWSVDVSTHLVVCQRSAIWMLVRHIVRCAWEASSGIESAWRTKTPNAAPWMEGGGRRGGILGRSAFSRVWLCGLACLVYIATYVVYVPRRGTRIALRTRGIRPYMSLSFWKRHLSHGETSLVDCDSYEASYRTMDSTTCWNMPLAASRISV